MCHFITMVVPPRTDLAALNEALRRHGRGVEPIENRHVVKLLKPGETYLWPSGKRCDCGTALGSLNEATRPTGPRDLRREVAKLRRKRWSETKIERWCAQMRANVEKEIRQTEEQLAKAATGAEDPDGWCALLRSLCDEAGLTYVGILLHMYSGGLDERIAARRVTLPLDDRLAEVLFRMDEDVLYVFEAGRRRA